MGIDDIWPDDPQSRVRYTVEIIRFEFETEYVADHADVSEATAQEELETLEDEGWVTRTDEDRWRVNTEYLGPDNLIPDEHE